MTKVLFNSFKPRQGEYLVLSRTRIASLKLERRFQREGSLCFLRC